MNTVYDKITKVISQYRRLILVGHKNMDLDALGSCLGIYKLAKSMNKDSFIYLEDKISLSSTNKALAKLKLANINIQFIHKSDLESIEEKGTLLVILDLHKREMLDYPELLDLYSSKILIDHHIRSVGSIGNTLITYINSRLSSVVEFVVNYLEYMNIKVSPMVATIMLAGLEIDTNNYNIKTTYKTFETAAALSLMGANNIDKQSVMQEKMDDYIQRQDLIKTSYMLNANMAICIVPSWKLCTKTDLAIIAEDLLQFEDVEASFALGYTNENEVSISARSLGKIDVQSIMKKLGGGGHKSEAASQINDTTINDVKEQILEIVK